MKTQKSTPTNHIRRLLLMGAVICSMAFAACSEVGRTAETNTTVRLQSSAVGQRQTGDNLTIGSRTYDAKDRSFDRPWPFGPEFDPQ